MSYEIKWTEYDGFPVQHGEEFTEGLNHIFSRVFLQRQEIEAMGRSLFSELSAERKRTAFNYRQSSITHDNYEWFSGLEYEINGERVAILFPWNKERSINVYTTGNFKIEDLISIVDSLVKKLLVRAYTNQKIGIR